MSEPDRSARPFDIGLQPERTALAWRRTSLALVVGALVCIRVLPTMVGPWAAIPSGVGLLAAIALLWRSQRRYAAHHRTLTSADHDRVPLSDGKLPAAVALLTLGGGVFIAIAVLAAAASR